jgi:phage-related protein
VAWSVVYYTDADEKEPVREAIEALTAAQRVRVLRTIGLLEELGTRLPQPHAKFLGDGLWELRTQVAGDAFRTLYFTWTEGRFVLLHLFQKKTQKTPEREINTAQRRRADWLARHKKKP